MTQAGSALAASSNVDRERRANPWIRRGLVFLACAILLDGRFGDHGLAQTMKARRDYERAANELVRLEAENRALRDEMHRLEADPAAVEAVARQELGLIRPGEILVVVKDVK
jgi:cell division protein FtsB